MEIAILSCNRKLYSTRRLVEAGEQRCHEVRVLNALKCYMDIASHEPSVHKLGEQLEPVDAVIPRIGASVTFYWAAVLRQFEVMGAYSMNESVAITRSRDKLRCLQILARAGIGLPLTGFASEPGGTSASRAANNIGLNMAAVDLLRSNHGAVVIEVNSTPGLQGIESATDRDVAAMVIELIEKNARPHRTRSRGVG